MAAPQSAAQTAAKRPPEAGDIAPTFKLAATTGEVIDPASDLVAGKPLLLLLGRGDNLPQGLGALVAQLKATAGRAVLVTALGETAGQEGFESAADSDGSARALFGEAQLVLIAPNRHVAYIGGDAAAAETALARIAATRASVVMTSHPPVLITPDVLSRADCQKLINIFAMQGQTFVDPGHGTLPPGNSDYKQKIPEYGRKDRIDHWIRQPETNAFIDDRLSRRLFPEIQKSFQYKITRREIYRIGAYEGERGGELHGHRDNTKAMVAHRRFACSINLNTEQFEGGELRYPEFGNQLYRPETGAAITFSCSLLHEPMHVTKGRRFVLLAFLYGNLSRYPSERAMQQQISVITLGIADLARSRRFYAEGFGWKPVFQNQDVIFYQMNGLMLGTWLTKALEADSKRSLTRPGAFSIAHNVRAKEDVQPVIDRLAQFGGKVLRPADAPPHGGFRGYIADPDDHTWEIAWNPAWPISPEGYVSWGV